MRLGSRVKRIKIKYYVLLKGDEREENPFFFFFFFFNGRTRGTWKRPETDSEPQLLPTTAAASMPDPLIH